MRFEHKIALVTGSGRGIGRAIALRLAHEGADVAVNFFRNREPAEATARAIEALGRRAHLIRANVGEPDDLERLVAETARHLGGLDILVNNAASGYNRPVLEQRIKGWDWTLSINARAALFLAQHAAPVMAGRGGGACCRSTSTWGRVRPRWKPLPATWRWNSRRWAS